MDFDMTQLLDAILDTLIPPSEDGRMPGAGSLGIAKALRAQIADHDEVVNANFMGRLNSA